MCIRDRLKPSSGDPIVGPSKDMVMGVYYLTVDEDEKAETCLLYTSDAADERSSVDLGGRRIIKKKNKNKIQLE